MRTGPNARPDHPTIHAFLEDGMVHGVRLEAGRATAYRNRWVRTRSFLGETTYVNWFGKVDLTASVANTSVVAHAGKIMALVESSFPYEITRTLGTVGPLDFGGRLKSPFTAHPKRDPVSGELLAFGMGLVHRGLTYLRIDPAGALVERRDVPIPRTVMMHDFAVTQRSAIFLDLPLVFDVGRAKRGEIPYYWDPKHPSRLGILDRANAGAKVRWLTIDPCFVFHVGNAFDDGDAIVLDVARYADIWREHQDSFGDAYLHRWTIDRASGTLRDERIGERPVEFPRVDERRSTLRHRYVYGTGYREAQGTDVVRYDMVAGGEVRHRFGPGTGVGEFTFVPAGAGAAEDAGWLIGFVYDPARDASDLAILDASDLAAPPVASVHVPARVPYGFHGSWIAQA